MRSFFYPKLALTNIKKNARFYYPYLLTCSVTIAMFYVMVMIANNEGLIEMRGYDALVSILGFGTYVVGIFSVIFLLYTNSFLVKRRKKELGLFNILGMEKRHIARILVNESIISGCLTIVFGLVTGVIFSKLMFLILFTLVRFSVPIGFEVRAYPVLVTIGLFAAINLLTLVINIIQVSRSKPIELILGNNTGEKEPKSRLWMTLIGLVSLSSGYTIAITTEKPLAAINLFFVAVLLVILGTYCLFVAGSISLLKILRKKKSFYYDKKHFMAISSMFYRMKQNAVGLASICILSTMVLVMVSTTVSLYAGVQDALNLRYPSDVSIVFSDLMVNEDEHLKQLITGTLKEQGYPTKELVAYTDFTMILKREGNNFSFQEQWDVFDDSTSFVTVMSNQDYFELTQDVLMLSDNEAIVVTNEKKLVNDVVVLGKNYAIKKKVGSIPLVDSYQYMTTESLLLIVNQTEFESLFAHQKAVFKDLSEGQYYRIAMNFNGDTQEKLAAYSTLSSLMKDLSYEFKDEAGTVVLRDSSTVNAYLTSRQANESSFYSMYGGFLFLGLFLGLLFMCATVLIIYYKQISEGYDDKERYSILKKVGMSYDEIKASIRSQILIIFFLPLSFGILHIAFAFKLITKLMILFNLTNVTLFLWCTGFTLIVFSIIYSVVYGLTAKVYYRIVS